MSHSDIKNGSQSALIRKERSEDPLPCEEGPGVVAYLLTLGSFLLVTATLPFSLFFVVKVVQVIQTRLFLNVHPIINRNMRGQLYSVLDAFSLEEPEGLVFSSSFRALTPTKRLI